MPPRRTSGRSSVSFSVLSSVHLLTHPAEVGTDLGSKHLSLLGCIRATRCVPSGKPVRRIEQTTSANLASISRQRLTPQSPFTPGVCSTPSRRAGVGVESERHSDRHLHGRSLGGQAVLHSRGQIRRKLPPPNPNAEKWCNESALLRTRRSPSPLAWLTVNPLRSIHATESGHSRSLLPAGGDRPADHRTDEHCSEFNCK